jgi:hypothetical protein
MPEKKTFVEVETNGRSYLGWRGELLAELALARVPGLVVHKLAGNGLAERGFDFVVAAEPGLCFFVVVKAFSSAKLGLDHVENVAELRWDVDADLIRRARESHDPVFLFLFDADTDHGRYLRLDTLPTSEVRQQSVVLPIEQTLNRESLQRLVNELAQVARP